eukprot:TRINITY_DN4813_c0_g3_i1.p1 TRINITY_DN4813_c0_g3~~TRINITY_DN4813_c0_g3_i1.p1  ORF type:complete len:214 (-),score=40.12 TRINITY_DN4813_c0_g3_i1:110-751(-)
MGQVLGLDYEPPSTGNVVVLGCHKSGKTSLLTKLEKIDMTPEQLAAEIPEQPADTPTSALKYFDIKMSDKLELCIADLSGHPSVREMWRQQVESYVYDCVVWVVDGTDRSKLDEARMELDRMMTLLALKNRPVVVVVTKRDLPAEQQIPTDEITKKLKLQSFAKKWIFSVSAVTGEGVQDAFDRVVKVVRRIVRIRDDGEDPFAQSDRRVPMV